MLSDFQTLSVPAAPAASIAVASAQAAPCHCADVTGDNLVDVVDLVQFFAPVESGNPEVDFVVPFGVCVPKRLRCLRPKDLRESVDGLIDAA